MAAPKQKNKGNTSNLYSNRNVGTSGEVQVPIKTTHGFTNVDPLRDTRVGNLNYYGGKTNEAKNRPTGKASLEE